MSVATPSVLFLDQSGDLGGAELMLLDLARRWPGRCVVVTLADGAFPTALREAGVETSVVPLGAAAGGRKRASVRAVAGAVASVRRSAAAVADLARGFDVVYANTQKALVVGARAAKLAGKPLVFHQHDLITASHFSRLNRAVAMRTINRHAAAVVANSRASAVATREAGGGGRG